MPGTFRCASPIPSQWQRTGTLWLSVYRQCCCSRTRSVSWWHYHASSEASCLGQNSVGARIKKIQRAGLWGWLGSGLPWRFSFALEVAPMGTAAGHGMPLAPCNQSLASLQPCQEARAPPGTQAFYRVDLSLSFAEAVSPVHWTVEHFFQCVGKCGTLKAHLLVTGTRHTRSRSLPWVHSPRTAFHSLTWRASTCKQRGDSVRHAARTG